MKVKHEARVISRLCTPTTTEAKLSGPLCTPIDITSEQIQVPEDIALDDLVGIFNAGAYGFSMSPQLFLSHPSPVEVLVLDGEIIETRRRGTYEDFLLKQNPLPGSV
jgi:diaminopimelate decarboxylase